MSKGIGATDGNLQQPKQNFQEAIKNTSSEELKFSPQFPLELELSLYWDCTELPYPCPICKPSGNCSERIPTKDSIKFLEVFFSEHQSSSVQYFQDLHKSDRWQNEQPERREV
jgi:hypothetical protein